MNHGKLVIVRHGESEWNAAGRWTGLTDVHITEKGRKDARLMGELLKDIRFDRAYVSEQIRTLETLQELLKTQGQTDLPTDRSGAINERDYGDYTGMNKWEVKEKVGEEQFNAIRRNWDCPVPNGEMLKDVYERAVPFLLDVVLPQLKEGKNILLVSHGNAIRALMKYIETISDQNVAHTEMIFGTILIYDLNDDGRLGHKEERKIVTEATHA